MSEKTDGGPAPGTGSRKALWSLVLGIVGLLCCPVLSIVALVLGMRARTEIRTSGGVLTGDGQAQGAIVLGIVGCVLWASGLAFWAILVATGTPGS